MILTLDRDLDPVAPSGSRSNGVRAARRYAARFDMQGQELTGDVIEWDCSPFAGLSRNVFVLWVTTSTPARANFPRHLIFPVTGSFLRYREGAGVTFDHWGSISTSGCRTLADGKHLPNARRSLGLPRSRTFPVSRARGRLFLQQGSRAKSCYQP